MVVYHERLGGFREACAAHGIAGDDIIVVEGETNRRGGIACLETALAMAEPPTAALCFNDAVAFGAMLALRKRGLEPGADFAVVGFDDIFEAEHYVPALTSVAVDIGRPRRARRACRAEDDPVAHDARRGPFGAVNLVVRESCGPDRRAGMGDAA